MNTKKVRRTSLFASLLHVLGLCIIVGAISIFLVQNTLLIGVGLIGLGVLCLLSLLLVGITIRSVFPDIIFGVIDNGILAIAALFGAHFAGVTGAILGGIVGNAITDGIAGIFEGYSAEQLRSQDISDKRTVLTSAVGKMAGCLLGAGVVMFVSSFISLF